MGIPFYYTYLIKSHRTIVSKFHELKSPPTTLFLDSNSIIYNECHDKSSEKEIILAVYRKIIEYIEKFGSTFTFAAFDGVPPFAKIVQQRNRRYKSSLTRTLLDEEKKWDTCSITPGTEFMRKLNQTLKDEFEMTSHNIFLSTSHDFGEGEYKIFKYIRDNSAHFIDKDVIIYGLDADLIMLSLFHLKFVRNIYLYRETPEFIKSIHMDMNPDDEYILNVAELKEIINRTCDIETYLVLGFLLGNDFLPHFPSLNIRKNGMQNLLSLFKQIDGELVNRNDRKVTINWNTLRLVINQLAKKERENFCKLYSNSSRKHTIHYSTPADKINNIPIMDTTTERKINPHETNWRYSYYKILFDIDINNDRDAVKKICVNYLQGLEWTLKYYTGNEIDATWSYLYEYPPLFEDLLNYTPFYEIEFVNKKENEFNETMQLCYVLPGDSLNLLPDNVRLKLDMDWYRNDCEILWCYCRYFWESHAILPSIDLEKLKEITQ